MTREFSDQSIESAYGLEDHDIFRLLATRPEMHLFPNLSRAYIMEAHLSPLFLSPTISELHLTVSFEDQHGHASYMEDTAPWISDYISNLKALHIYPWRILPTSDSHSPATATIRSILHGACKTLTETSFPVYYADWGMLQSLLQSENLRSIQSNYHSLAGPAEPILYTGCQDILHWTYSEIHFPMNLALPFKNLVDLDISFPYPSIATQLLRETVLTQLDSLTLHFTVLKPDNLGVPSPAQFSLTPLFYRIYDSAPQVQHLKIFMVPSQRKGSSNIRNVPIVNWIDLSPITLLVDLVSFEITHVYPIDISSHHIAKITRGLPSLTRFILNPHPVIIRSTSYGLDVLFAMAAWGKKLKEVGIFMNYHETMPSIQEGVFFDLLRTLYVGLSFTPEDDTIYNATCHALYYLLPPSAKIKTCPSSLAPFRPVSTFFEDNDGSLSEFSDTCLEDLQDAWVGVRGAMKQIHETVILVHGSRMVRREDMEANGKS